MEDKLTVLQNRFFLEYPNGFEDDKIKEIIEKHKMKKLKEFAKEKFSKESFLDKERIIDEYIKLIQKSSLVSVFEKTKLKSVKKELETYHLDQLNEALYELIHGNQEIGFEMITDILDIYGIAKWPIITVLGVYLNPEYEVLVKPTTVKGILEYFQIKDIKYTVRPNYNFYNEYRKFINELKKDANKSLNVDNAAFCGFIMMAIDKNNS
jgi:hypothetical protein